MTYEDYLSIGFSVFPVGPDKRPLVGWKTYQQRFPTIEEIKQWRTQFPSAGIGGVTGPISKTVVIDVDGVDGMKSQTELGYPLPVTRISKTPRGYHYFFKWSPRLEKHITTLAGIAKGIDVRGRGGYVVLPSSSMLDREWKLQEDLAELPDEWYSIIPFNGRQQGTSLNMSEKMAEISEGNRHDTFLRLAGKLMSAKLGESEIIATLMPLAEEHHFEKELFDLVKDMHARYSITPKSGFKIEPVEALLAQPEPVLEWMIEGLWTAHAKGLLVGQPNLGKTWVALDMLISVATGLPCLGKFAPIQTGPVLLIEQEGSLANLNRRFHMLAKGRGLQASALRHLHHMSFQFPKVPDNEKEIIALMKGQGIKFVVFDSLVRFHSKDENSSTDMRLILESFSRINMETGASLMLIHHLAKQSAESKKGIWERVRGTSDFVAWRDCMMGLEGMEGDEHATCSFQFRDAENPGQIQIIRTLDESTGAMAMRTIGIEETEDFQDRAEKAYSILRANFGGLSRDNLVKKLGGKRNETWAFVGVLLAKKMVVKSGGKLVVP